MNPAIPRRKTGVIEKIKRALLANSTSEEEACGNELDQAVEELKRATQDAGKAVRALGRHMKKKKTKQTENDDATAG
ncbi:MAG TPA: hypothetical protein VFH61_03650 [Thermoleophilia bacterium]|nr:hypothetical protein [Thermoleophilia bacterium]